MEIPKKKVMLADDNKDFRTVYGIKLSRLVDLELYCCSRDAHNRLFGRDYNGNPGLDLLILDNNMPPGMPGADLALKAMRIFPNLPIIIYSSDPLYYFNHLKPFDIKLIQKPDEETLMQHLRLTLGIK